MIYSSSYIWASFKYGNAYKYFISQFCFLIIGIFMMFVFFKIDYNLYKKQMIQELQELQKLTKKQI